LINSALFFSPFELDVDKFAKLWAACEHECKASVTSGKMEISGIVDNIVNKCHMALIQVTGMHCVTMELFCQFS